ncbi:NAD(P)-binding protein [Saccharata proteae CBS 121410]|uniref:NAD(P)-binding protein n=1 Tax=Saccharata proteae CBS 121410 TaxID=1314787 RepID=A0A6A5YEP0_9PEZI|nr:NAD(P)-binding protein [Saccharata proteae CBS 121410]
MPPRVFLITGTSTGFGYELVQHCLSRGDHVVATARNPSTLSFPLSTTQNLLTTALDVTSRGSIEAAFAAALDKFGRVDVVVNNAGYGLAGEFESLSDDEIRRQMEVNFFGLLDVTRRAVEVMRDENGKGGGKRGGVIQQVTSIGGQVGVPLFSIYCASKFAVEGFTEALSHELHPDWNISLTLLEPGGFRTDWAGRSMAFAAQKHPAYDHLNAQDTMGKRHGNQPGDPAKAAKVFYELAVMEDPPLRCTVGTDAFERMVAKVEREKERVEKFRDLTNSTDVDGYVKPS